MIEVESKIKISDPKKYRSLARSIAKYKGKQKKSDNYYTLESLRSRPKKSLRIRKKDKIYEINFKESISYVKGIHAKRESEFHVSNLKTFMVLMKNFGFRLWVQKEKISEIYEINPKFHIEINHVKHLGYFIEIEYLCSENQIPKARLAILDVMKKLHINKKHIIKEGYTHQLWKIGKHLR